MSEWKRYSDAFGDTRTYEYAHLLGIKNCELADSLSHHTMPQLRKKYRVWVKFYCWSLSHFSSMRGNESRSSALRTHQNRFRPRTPLRELTTLPLVGWMPHPLGAFGASILRPYRHFFFPLRGGWSVTYAHGILSGEGELELSEAFQYMFSTEH